MSTMGWLFVVLALVVSVQVLDGMVKESAKRRRLKRLAEVEFELERETDEHRRRELLYLRAFLEDDVARQRA